MKTEKYKVISYASLYSDFVLRFLRLHLSYSLNF